MVSKKLVVLALGGNAIATKSRSFQSQYSAIKIATKAITYLAADYRVVITHGNGPQVGDALLRNEHSSKIVPPLPLHACVAETQGMLGAMIQLALAENLGKKAKVASLVTKVMVSARDAAFARPTKPVGPLYSKHEFVDVKRENPSAVFRKVVYGKYRRVVASPDPISILEMDAVRKLAENDYIVIACGGGGVPVTVEGDNIAFVDAVIDKDLASERLATGIGASMLVSLTDVAGAYINFESRNKKLLKRVQVDEMRKLLDAGNFGQGSMEPKVKAAVRFVENTGNSSVIAHLGSTGKAVRLQSGMVVYK